MLQILQEIFKSRLLQIKIRINVSLQDKMDYIGARLYRCDCSMSVLQLTVWLGRIAPQVAVRIVPLDSTRIKPLRPSAKIVLMIKILQNQRGQLL